MPYTPSNQPKSRYFKINGPANKSEFGISAFIISYTQKIDQRSSQTIDSLMIFTETNPIIKKNHTPIKTIVTIKAGTEEYPCNYQFIEEDVKSETRVEHKNMK